MKLDLQKLFIREMQGLHIVAKNLTDHENAYEAGQFTDELRASYKDEYAIYQKADKTIRDSIYPILVISDGGSCALRDEIESNVMNCINATGYVRGIVQKLANEIDATKIQANKYSGGVAYGDLQYYINNFLGQLHCLCQNYDIDFCAILETETYLYSGNDTLNAMQKKSSGPDHDKFKAYFIAKKDWWDKLLADISAGIISGKGDYTIVAMAKVIYDSGKLHHTMKPARFAPWLRAFCDVWAIDHTPTCKAGNNGVKAEISRMKNVFYYFDDSIPQ